MGQLVNNLLSFAKVNDRLLVSSMELLGVSGMAEALVNRWSKLEIAHKDVRREHIFSAEQIEDMDTASKAKSVLVTDQDIVRPPDPRLYRAMTWEEFICSSARKIAHNDGMKDPVEKEKLRVLLLDELLGREERAVFCALCGGECTRDRLTNDTPGLEDMQLAWSNCSVDRKISAGSHLDAANLQILHVACQYIKDELPNDVAAAVILEMTKAKGLWRPKDGFMESINPAAAYNSWTQEDHDIIDAVVIRRVDSMNERIKANATLKGDVKAHHIRAAIMSRYCGNGMYLECFGIPWPVDTVK